MPSLGNAFSLCRSFYAAFIFFIPGWPTFTFLVKVGIHPLSPRGWLARPSRSGCAGARRNLLFRTAPKDIVISRRCSLRFAKTADEGSLYLQPLSSSLGREKCRIKPV